MEACFSVNKAIESGSALPRDALYHFKNRDSETEEDGEDDSHGSIVFEPGCFTDSKNKQNAEKPSDSGSDEKSG
jgi:hypothetical protein